MRTPTSSFPRKWNYPFLINRLLNPQSVTFVLAISIVAVSLAFHEPWLDEADAPLKLNAFGWNLWKLMESFRGNGHFPLYHILLFPIFNLGRSVGIDSFLLVKSFTFIQYVVLAFLVCRWVAFPLSLLFLLSYYPIYEFGTISRCYLLALVFLLIIVKDFIADQSSTRFSILRIIAYFGFPLTHVLSFVFSIPLLLCTLFHRKWVASGVMMFSFSICAYYLSIRDPSDPFSQFGYLRSVEASLLGKIRIFWNSILLAWYPVSFEERWWNRSFVSNLEGFQILLSILLTLIVIIFIIGLFRKQPRLTSSFCIGGFACALLLTYKYQGGSLRHIGYVVWPFLILFVLLSSSEIDSSHTLVRSSSWDSFQRYLGVQTTWNHGSKLLFDKIFLVVALTLLFAHSLFGMTAVARDIISPFDSSTQQLQAIRSVQDDLGEIQIFAHPCWSFMQLSTLSNWEYDSSPLWSAELEGCGGGYGLPESLESLENTDYPDRMLLSLWGSDIQDRSLFPNPDLNDQIGNITVEQVIHQKGLACKELETFTDVQTTKTYLYLCET